MANEERENCQIREITMTIQNNMDSDAIIETAIRNEILLIRHAMKNIVANPKYKGEGQCQRPTPYGQQ